MSEVPSNQQAAAELAALREAMADIALADKPSLFTMKAKCAHLPRCDQLAVASLLDRSAEVTRAEASARSTARQPDQKRELSPWITQVVVPIVGALLAGAGALGAGIYAYRAAIEAATIQSRAAVTAAPSASASASPETAPTQSSTQEPAVLSVE